MMTVNELAAMHDKLLESVCDARTAFYKLPLLGCYVSKEYAIWQALHKSCMSLGKAIDCMR